MRCFFSVGRVLGLRAFVAAAALGVGAAGSVGCESDGQTGALLGAGLGAVAGQAIGGDSGATLIGAAVGGGAGYLIGNERDKASRRDTGRPEPIAPTHRGATLEPAVDAVAEPVVEPY